MFIYNVTVRVEKDIEADWVSWMSTIHIPDVIQTGCFVNARLLKMLSEHDQDDASTYATQYIYLEPEQLDIYLELHAPKLREEHTLRFHEKALAFRTLLEVIKSF